MKLFSLLRRPRLVAWNIAEGTHRGGNITRLTDAAITTRFLIGKIGTDEDHVAVCSGTTDVAQGIITDEAAAAELPVNVALLSSPGTLKVTLGATVAAGAQIAPTASGTAQTAVSTQYAIGRTLRAGVSGDVVEFTPNVPGVALS